MTRFHYATALAGVIFIAAATGSASAGDKSENKEVTETHTTKTQTTKKSRSHSDDPGAPAADNSGVNQRDRKDSEPTADQQKNNKSDLTITAEIRRAVMADKDLSINAHNVKIIAQNGKVTLKGPVNNVAEKKTVEGKAEAVAGRENVTSEIAIKQ
jgi:BON domain